MLTKRATSLITAIFFAGCVCLAQQKTPSKPILRVDEKVSGPFGGQKSTSCLRIYSDGKVLYANWRNSAMSIVDKDGNKSRPEQTISLEHKVEEGDLDELSTFFESKSFKRLPEQFSPPHTPIDYIESISVQTMTPKGKSKQIAIREFYVASLEEKARYPAALILLMGRIDEIEQATLDKGKPVGPPADCQLKVENH
jgi:hypothetical protein